MDKEERGRKMKKTVLIFLYLLFAFAAIAEVGVEKEGDIVSIKLLDSGEIIEGESVLFNVWLGAKFAADENECVYVMFPAKNTIYKYDKQGVFLKTITITHKDVPVYCKEIFTYDKKLYIRFWTGEYKGIIITDYEGVFKEIHKLDESYNTSHIYFKEGCFFGDSGNVIWSQEKNCDKKDMFNKHEINYDNLESKKTITINPEELVLQLPDTGFDYFDARILDADNGEYKILITAKDENVYYETVHGKRLPGNTHWVVGYKNNILLYTIKLETAAAYPRLYFSENSVFQLGSKKENEMLKCRVTKWNLKK
ncbi:MAG: hypothetical protein JXR81_08870 [Candidatus Goldbacteria bacterium]|nr:hypothetical protein [Candidatus Goldiibacteriota bacterium]